MTPAPRPSRGETLLALTVVGLRTALWLALAASLGWTLAALL